MSTVVQQTKLSGETITVRVSFQSRCRIGETIATCISTMEVYSGEDENVADMLVESSTISENYLVSQKVTAGVPGVTYKLYVAARSTDNNIYIQEAFIVVLESPDIVPADL